ncbi:MULTISPECIES: hypothetical protein [Comamonas]|uniref:hypothetical protein n=1 Tax=Comamonas TaxID=283 RepID=UPI0001DA6924|nr:MULTISPECIES: hypothetical protein [Comamonas]EFI59786.1 hypothetical protein CTS44_20868 [Comamonas thiooxydans]TFF58270.1 hypothetical protein EIC84_16240 [Comamonas sp. A23]
MRRTDAQQAILGHWVNWQDQLSNADMHPHPGTAMHLFYEYMQARHPEVLDFASYSPYLEMRLWIAEDNEP